MGERKQKFGGRIEPPSNRSATSSVHTGEAQQEKKKKKRLTLPPNACFITKFMVMAFNSLPSLSEKCYNQV